VIVDPRGPTPPHTLGHSSRPFSAGPRRCPAGSATSGSMVVGRPLPPQRPNGKVIQGRAPGTALRSAPSAAGKVAEARRTSRRGAGRLDADFGPPQGRGRWAMGRPRRLGTGQRERGPAQTARAERPPRPVRSGPTSSKIGAGSCTRRSRPFPVRSSWLFGTRIVRAETGTLAAPRTVTVPWWRIHRQRAPSGQALPPLASRTAGTGEGLGPMVMMWREPAHRVNNQA